MRILYICGQENNPLAKSLSRNNSVIIYPKKQNDIEKVLKNIPKPDLIFFQEEQPLLIPKNLEKVNIPKAVYLVDLHLHYKTWHKDFAKLFNFVFVAQKPYVKKLKKNGLNNVFWLPLYSDPDCDKNLKLKRVYDIGFVGTINRIQNPKRSFLLWLLKMKFKTKIGENVNGKKRGEIYNQSQIGINLSIASDLNFRTFEVMASGAMLLVDRQDSILSLFKNKEHLVIYNNLFEALKLAKYYLKNEGERINIQKAGQKEVITKHSSRNRADMIIKTIKKSRLYPAKKNNSLPLFIMGKSYVFNHKKQESASYFGHFLKEEKGLKLQRLEALTYLSLIKHISEPKLWIFIRIIRRFLISH